MQCLLLHKSAHYFPGCLHREHSCGVPHRIDAPCVTQPPLRAPATAVDLKLPFLFCSVLFCRPISHCERRHQGQTAITAARCVTCKCELRLESSSSTGVWKTACDTTSSTTTNAAVATPGQFLDLWRFVSPCHRATCLTAWQHARPEALVYKYHGDHKHKIL